MGSPALGNVRPRVSVGLPETADWYVCPLLVSGSGELPRCDAKDVNDRAVAAGVESRLVDKAASLALIRFWRLEDSTSEGFLPVVSDCTDLEVETAFLELAVLRMILLFTTFGCSLVKGEITRR